MGESNRSSNTQQFNLTEQSGVLQALLAVRTSSLPSAKKNELRDEIFTYTKSGGDQRLRELLEQRLADLPLSKEFLAQQKQDEAVQQKSTKRELGRRAAPSFSVHKKPQLTENATNITKKETAAQQQPEPSPTPVTSDKKAAPKPTPPVAPTPPSAPVESPAAAVEKPTAPTPAPEPKAPPAPAADTQPTPAPTPAPTAPTSAADQAIPTNLPTAQSAPEQTTPAPTAPTTPNSEAPQQPVPSPQPTPAPTPAAAEQAPAPTAPAPEPAAAPAQPQSSNAPTIERIREIKRYINDKVGNPVNLVDIDNTIGRAYMTALLEAMQSVNAETGRAGDAQMSKLEDVFKQVKTLLEDKAVADAPQAQPPTSVANEPQQPAPASEPAPAPAPAPAPEPTPAPAPQPSAKNVPVKNPVSAAQTTKPQSSVPSEVPVKKQIPASEASETFSPVASHATENDAPKIAPQQRVEKRQSADTSVTPSIYTSPQDTKKGQHGYASAQAGASNTPAAGGISGAPSLEQQLEELDKKNKKMEYDGDPLHAPEVDAGLQQLLLEWNLFKSSGLFGTGPNGLQHPLFKKLAPLMIQDVASGRFEDARPEVVQSISDYMNGWRYEQGIVYEPGETFEKYLRRVIRFILDSKS